MIASRRSLLKYFSTAPILIGATTPTCPWLFETAFAEDMSATKLGIITQNDSKNYLQFTTWLKRKPNLAQLYFNQNNASQLSSSISYICRQGAAFMADGAQILWSVPCPGARQLEEIVAGHYNSLYTNLFQSILAVSPKDGSNILVRLPWEFNLAWQENAAIDKTGKFDGMLFIDAWQQIATIAKAVSSRFIRIWCPNVTTMDLDPITCWPGLKYVDIIAQDFYMQKAWNKPGDFAWFRDEARGLAWGAAFAHSHGKQYALSEWGMDSDIFVPDFNNAASWLASLNAPVSGSPGWQAIGGAVHHQCWWDRPEVIDCRISNGMHPGLAAAYKSRFY